MAEIKVIRACVSKDAPIPFSQRSQVLRTLLKNADTPNFSDEKFIRELIAIAVECLKCQINVRSISCYLFHFLNF